eukprot:IDg12167t1
MVVLMYERHGPVLVPKLLILNINDQAVLLITSSPSSNGTSVLTISQLNLTTSPSEVGSTILIVPKDGMIVSPNLNLSPYLSTHASGRKAWPSPKS